MLNRLYNLAAVLGVLYFFFDLAIFAPTPQRKYDLFAIVGIIAFRYVVRVPSLAAHSRGEGL